MGQSANITLLRRTLAAVGLVIVLSGCLTTNARTVFDEPTLRPGDNVTCAANPCTVYFETPAGSGTHDILQNGTIKAGVATGGVRVKLGSTLVVPRCSMLKARSFQKHTSRCLAESRG